MREEQRKVEKQMCEEIQKTEQKMMLVGDVKGENRCKGRGNCETRGV